MPDIEGKLVYPGMNFVLELSRGLGGGGMFTIGGRDSAEKDKDPDLGGKLLFRDELRLEDVEES